MAASSSSRRGSQRPTIGDVAAKSGVSIGAVSQAFNGGGRLRPATIERIRAAALELGWAPSSVARAMTGAPARAVGMIFRRPTEILDVDPFFPAFLSGLEATLLHDGYTAVIGFADGSRTEQETYQRLAREHRVDGFLLTDLRRSDPRYQLLDGLGLPAVVVGTPGSSCPFPSVDTDSDDQVRALVEHLIGEGHQVIAHVAGQRGLLHSGRRQRIWAQTLAKHGLPAGPVAAGDFTAAGGARATRSLLESPRRPTAIFYGNDVMAIAGLAVLSESGVRVPGDIAVGAFDDIPLASYMSPPLTTVHCDYRRLGGVAAQRLIALIGGTDVPGRTVFPAKLLTRGSTGSAVP